MFFSVPCVLVCVCECVRCRCCALKHGSSRNDRSESIGYETRLCNAAPKMPPTLVFFIYFIFFSVFAVCGAQHCGGSSSSSSSSASSVHGLESSWTERPTRQGEPWRGGARRGELRRRFGRISLYVAEAENR